jgi:ABC-type transporter MlaC component
MKKFIFLLAMLVFAQVGFAQKVKSAQVPQAVKTAFAKKFPAIKAKWEMEDGNYEAEFKNKEKVEMSAVFTAEGKWLETEQEIKKSALPAPVLKALLGKKVKESAKIQRADGTTVFEAEVGGKDLLFDAIGNAL